MTQNRYFRAGAGAVIYNDAGEILLFARTDDQTRWQPPQGGMDNDETSLQTLWRELFEETAIRQEDIEKVDPYPEWLFYEYPSELQPNLKDQNCLGQIHKWYFLKLKPEVTIDLDKASDHEFDQFKWSTITDFLNQAVDFKHTVYKKLTEYFISNLKS